MPATQIQLNPLSISMDNATADKLLVLGSGDAALLYLYLLRYAGEYDPAAAERQLHARRARFSALNAGLDAMSPLKVLARGYTVTEREGELLSSVKQVELLDRIEVRFHDGSAVCTVNEINGNP